MRLGNHRRIRKTPTAAIESARINRRKGESNGIADAGCTVIDTVELLFALFGSGCGAAETVAVLLSGPAALSVTCKTIVALPPFAIVPTEHVTVGVPLQVPWDGVAEIRVAPAGRTSVTTTAFAAPGPEFVTARL